MLMEDKTFSCKENTWNWKFEKVGVENAEYLLEIQVLPQNNGNRLPVVQENFPDEEAEQSIKEGWGKAMQDLKTTCGNSKVVR